MYGSKVLEFNFFPSKREKKKEEVELLRTHGGLTLRPFGLILHEWNDGREDD